MSVTRGREILRDRMREIPEHFRAMLATPLPPLPDRLRANRLIATGVGSSEAAARYFVALLNAGGVVAEFRPPSFFYSSDPNGIAAGTSLALFSQGLAPNAGIVLAHRHRFVQTMLFTAATAEGQRAAGKESRAAMLEKLADEGAAIVRHPLENEYEILPRVVGPVCALAAAYRVAQALTRNDSADKPEHRLETVVPWFDAGETGEDRGSCAWAEDLVAGVNFLFTNPSGLYAQNLSCKILEGIFRSPPVLYDALTYSHGPFQLDCVAPRAKWLFTSGAAEEVDMIRCLRPLLERAGPLRVVTSPLPEPLSIFYYEAFLNRVILAALERYPVDLINWPGKGLDREGYDIDRPYSPT